MSRPDGRANDQLRPLVLERSANPYAEGSCLIRMGGTLVHCTASVEPGVPGFKKGTGEGWVTAEYAMLPRATLERTQRERNGPGGRTQEIQRLIGRSLRAAMATMAFGEYTIRIDCDVLQADGGTRTAGITGGVHRAGRRLRLAVRENRGPVAFRQPRGGRVGRCRGGRGAARSRLYRGSRRVRGLQRRHAPSRQLRGSAGHRRARAPSPATQLETLLDMAERGIAELFAAQRKVLGW